MTDLDNVVPFFNAAILCREAVSSDFLHIKPAAYHYSIFCNKGFKQCFNHSTPKTRFLYLVCDLIF